MMRAFLLYTGPDGNSHVKRGTVSPNALVEAQSVLFQETPAHSSLEWHVAPRTQFVITLAGTLEFDTRDGETFTVHPGDVLIATDYTGSGHEWRLVDDNPWKRAYVAFQPGTDPQFVAEK